jgi:hypothetical protein
VSVYDIVNVIAVRYGFVSTAWTMNVVSIVSAACMFWCAYVGIGCIDIQGMLVDMLTMWVVEVDVVQIVDMIIVNDGGMSTVLVVNMGVAFVF